MSEPNAPEAKETLENKPADLSGDPTEEKGENPPEQPKKSRPQVDLKALFNTDPLLDQLEMQVGLLTAAMSENMILATGACPGLTEGPSEDEVPKNVWLRPKAGPAGNAWADARSLHLRDAARLSFATASLIGAYAKLKGPAPQRITARYTIIPDSGGGKKSRKITTVTHHVIASPDAQPRATQKG